MYLGRMGVLLMFALVSVRLVRLVSSLDSVGLVRSVGLVLVLDLKLGSLTLTSYLWMYLTPLN